MDYKVKGGVSLLRWGFSLKRPDRSNRKMGNFKEDYERVVGGTLPVIIVTLRGLCFCKHLCY
jgi:hypothetical protein